jgi:uncharacterized iron-regulated membrane protein
MLFKLHKYAGLIAGLLLAVSGVSGSLLVFHDTLDEWLTPRLLSDPTAEAVSLETVLAAAAAAVPGRAPQRLNLSRGPGSPHEVRFEARPGAPGPLQVSVTPAGEVRAIRDWGQYPSSWVYRLHYNLLAGTTGHYVVGAGGLLLLFFCLSGLYLWWPRGRRAGRWRRALTLRRDAGRFRFYFDLHRTAGFYLLPVLLVVAFSGVSLVFPGAVRALVGAVLPLDAPPAPHVEPNGAALSVDQVVARGRRAFPDAVLTRVDLPGVPTDPYRLAFNQPDEPWSNYGATRVWVDQYNGAILDIYNPLTSAAGSQVMSWQFPLHNGDALGLAGRWLILVSGLLPGLLFATGLYLWWRKRKPRRRRRPQS